MLISALNHLVIESSTGPPSMSQMFRLFAATGEAYSLHPVAQDRLANAGAETRKENPLLLPTILFYLILLLLTLTGPYTR